MKLGDRTQNKQTKEKFLRGKCICGNQLDLPGSSPLSIFGIVEPKIPLFEGLYIPGSPIMVIKRKKTCITKNCDNLNTTIKNK